MSSLTFELGVMARGIAGNADEADEHSEVKLLRSAIARIERLEAAVRYWSGYLEVDFAIKQAEARGTLARSSTSDAQGNQ